MKPPKAVVSIIKAPALLIWSGMETWSLAAPAWPPAMAAAITTERGNLQKGRITTGRQEDRYAQKEVGAGFDTGIANQAEGGWSVVYEKAGFALELRLELRLAAQQHRQAGSKLPTPWPS